MSGMRPLLKQRNILRSWGSRQRIFSRQDTRYLSGLKTENYLPGTSLLASVMAPGLDLTFQEALENFQTRQDLVSLWNQDMIESGMTVIYSDSNISIIDYVESQGLDSHETHTLCRGLYFNENLDLIQTSVPLNKETSQVDFLIPFPLESNKHIIGFSFALLFHQLNQSSQQNIIKRSAVLGAGGCSLPILLSLLYPQSTIDAIENNSSIVKVAKEYFGIADLGLEDRIFLHESCAMSWVDQKSREVRLSNCSSYDLLFLDIYETSSHSESLDCEAPAEVSLTNENISHYLNLLSDSGVMAINVFGNDLGTAVALHRIKEGVIEYLSSFPPSLTEENSMQFAVGIMNLPFQSKDSALSIEEQCEPSLPRYNSVIFIVKNYNMWLQNLMESKDDIVEKIEQAMNHLHQLQQLQGEVKIKFPFLREGEEEKRIVRDWLKTVRFVGIKR